MFSQAEEDDVLGSLLLELGIRRGRFVEIGVGPGNENNTYLLAQTPGWCGWWFGDEPILVPLPVGVIRAEQVTVTLDNVLELLVTAVLQPPIDVFSLDIDGNDFWIGQIAIEWLQPRIVIVEYYAPEAGVWVMPYTPGYRWSTGQPCGASLAAWQEWLREDYDLVYTTRAQVNAFFVRKGARRGGDVEDTLQTLIEELRALAGDMQRNEGRPSAQEIINRVGRAAILAELVQQNLKIASTPIPPVLAGNVVPQQPAGGMVGAGATVDPALIKDVVEQPLSPPPLENVVTSEDARRVLEDAAASEEPAVLGAGVGDGSELPPPPTQEP